MDSAEEALAVEVEAVSAAAGLAALVEEASAEEALRGAGRCQFRV